MDKDKKRQTKEQIFNYSEQISGYQGGSGWGMGEIGDRD